MFGFLDKIDRKHMGIFLWQRDGFGKLPAAFLQGAE